MTEIIHKELSYAVRGVLFDVHNQLGPLLPEKFYQEAVAIGLEAKGIACETEKPFAMHYCGVEVGRYFVDVWVEAGKLLLELKVAPEILPIHRAQAISYLKVTDADLAVVVNFGEAGLIDERLPNYVRNKPFSFSWHPQSVWLDIPDKELSNVLLKALHRVHFYLGPGFFHQVYRRATMVELREQEIGFTYVKEIPIYYRDVFLGNQPVRLISLDGEILLATIAVKELDDNIKSQMRARLRQLDKKVGLIANFHGRDLEVVLVRGGYNE
jgi:GxxExxY protein